MRVKRRGPSMHGLYRNKGEGEITSDEEYVKSSMKYYVKVTFDSGVTLDVPLNQLEEIE